MPPAAFETSLVDLEAEGARSSERAPLLRILSQADYRYIAFIAPQVAC